MRTVYATAFRHKTPGEGVGGHEWDFVEGAARDRVAALLNADPAYETWDYTLEVEDGATRDEITNETDAMAWADWPKTRYVVTFRSVVIEAASEEEAIDRATESRGGGNWEAVEQRDTTLCEKGESDADPRYLACDTEHYTLHSSLEPERGAIALYAVEDTESGYIAFTTTEEAANKIVDALRAPDGTTCGTCGASTDRERCNQFQVTGECSN